MSEEKRLPFAGQLLLPCRKRNILTWIEGMSEKSKTKTNFVLRVLRNRKLPLCNSISNYQFTLPRFLSVAYDDTHNFQSDQISHVTPVSVKPVKITSKITSKNHTYLFSLQNGNLLGYISSHSGLLVEFMIPKNNQPGKGFQRTFRKSTICTCKYLK